MPRREDISVTLLKYDYSILYNPLDVTKNINNLFVVCKSPHVVLFVVYQWKNYFLPVHK